MKGLIIIVTVLAFQVHSNGQPAFPFSDTSRFLNKELPDFEGTTLDNKKFKLSEHRGKVILVTFWYLACQACMQEVPDFNRLVREYPETDFMIVSVMQDKKADIQKKIVVDGKGFKFIKPVYNNQEINYIIVTDGKEIVSKYFNDFAAPKTFILDQRGVVRQFNSGYLRYFSETDEVAGANYSNFKARIEKLVAEK